MAQISLSSTLVSSFISSSLVVQTVSHSADCMDSFKVLLAHSILSCPVVNDSGLFLGFLDMKDLTALLVFSAERAMTEVPKMEKEMSRRESFRKEEIRRSISDDVMVRARREKYQEILNSGKDNTSALAGVTNEFVAKASKNAFVTTKSTLHDAAQLLLSHHRVAVLNEDGTVLSIISQTSLISYLLKMNDPVVNGLLSVKLKDSPVGSKSVFSVSSNTNAFNVFKILAYKNYSGVPIVNENGDWLAVTSASDLKLFVNQPNAEVLGLPILSFLAKATEQEAKFIEKDVKISVTENCTVMEVIRKLLAARIHRLFVSDQQAKSLISVVSVSDVLKYLISNLE